MLTQNTNWKNVEKALDNLKAAGIFSPQEIAAIPSAKLARLIRPSGYYRQKAKRLKIFSNFVLEFGSANRFMKSVTREQLLSVSGIGPETADSILLYACNKPYFVIDAYTRRILQRMKIIQGNESYSELQNIFHGNIPKDVGIYKEFHALIVEHAKHTCKKKAECEKCAMTCKPI